jgi:hypothetical protein
MSEDRDDRIVEFLRQAAPPARDPVFRLRVLERREQRQFHGRLFLMLAGLLVIVLITTLAPTGVLAVVSALASACLAFRGRLRMVLRRFSI